VIIVFLPAEAAVIVVIGTVALGGLLRLGHLLGCTAGLGCDAHSPDVFCDTAAEKQARILAESVGITLAEDIKLIKI